MDSGLHPLWDHSWVPRPLTCPALPPETPPCHPITPSPCPIPQASLKCSRTKPASRRLPVWGPGGGRGAPRWGRVGRAPLMVRAPEPRSHKAAGLRQHSCRALRGGDVGHQLQDLQLLHDGLRTRGPGWSPIACPSPNPPPHTHTHTVTPWAHCQPYPSLTLWLREEGLPLPFPMGCGRLAHGCLLLSLHCVALGKRQGKARS